MMWKTLIFLAVVSVVLAGKIKKHQTSYEFHIKHDYDYYKHHDKSEDHKDETEEQPAEEQQQQQEQEQEQEQEGEAVVENNEEAQSEEPTEETQTEAEPQNEENENGSEVSNTESEQQEEHDDTYEYPGYEFLYKVKDGYTHDIKGHHEKKYGGEVKGVYWLLQPDGLKRTVDYHVDKHNGFHAKVDYSKSEENEDEDKEHSKATSEYYVKNYHGYKKYIPVKEESQEEEEQDRQEESAQHIPIYVI